MQLDPTRWFVKLFFWSVGVWENFTGQNLMWKVEERTNLCFFVRVIVLWMPLSLAANIATLGATIGVLIWTPIHLFGFVTYLLILGVIIVVMGVFIVFNFLSDRLYQQKDSQSTVTRSGPAKKTVGDRGPGAWDIVIAWAKAQKNKVCPIITFKTREIA